MRSRWPTLPSGVSSQAAAGERFAARLRIQADLAQWAWGLQFLAACRDDVSRRTTEALLALAGAQPHRVRRHDGADRPGLRLFRHRQTGALRRCGRICRCTAANAAAACARQRAARRDGSAMLSPSNRPSKPRHLALRGHPHPQRMRADCFKVCEGLEASCVCRGVPSSFWTPNPPGLVTDGVPSARPRKVPLAPSNPMPSCWQSTRDQCPGPAWESGCPSIPQRATASRYVQQRNTLGRRRRSSVTDAAFCTPDRFAVWAIACASRACRTGGQRCQHQGCPHCHAAGGRTRRLSTRQRLHIAVDRWAGLRPATPPDCHCRYPAPCTRQSAVSIQAGARGPTLAGYGAGFAPRCVRPVIALTAGCRATRWPEPQAYAPALGACSR